MGVMVSEIYDAFIDAGVEEAKARAAVAAVPIGEHLATKQDIARLESRLYRALWIQAGGIVGALVGLVGTAIAVAYFLDRYLPDGALGP